MAPITAPALASAFLGSTGIGAEEDRRSKIVNLLRQVGGKVFGHRGSRIATGELVCQPLALYPCLTPRRPAEGSRDRGDHLYRAGQAADTLKRLPLKRQLLELYAARGRNLANYRARKAQLGL